MIKFFPVTSSNVDRIGWHGNVLYVQFKHGGCYRYDQVPLSAWTALLAAESTGSFINQQIKPNYPATKLEAGLFAD